MVKSFGNAEIWKLSKKDFSGLLDESIINQIKKRINLQKVEVELTNLNLIKVLGTGTYGNVYLVHHPISDKLYALKVFLRSTIIQLKVFELLQMEKKVMQELDHPLITKLVKTFKDESRFYLLIEYINGIDFFEYLFDKGLLPIQEARFYISCIILAVEHIHSRGIVYRDLKPENILIDNEGYPVLIDFGVSKLVQERTYTLIGTPHYMAPEIVQGAGYSFSCDCWSLGVLLYECLVGKVPFGHEENDLYSIYKDIISFQFKFPKKFMDSPVKGVIEGLLEVEPEKRLKISECKNHEWLHGVNWDYLIGKFSKPPFIPKNQEIETLSGKPFDEVIYVKFIQDYESCTLLEYDEDVQLNEDIFNDF
jgi:cGMP-dependent protein kinase